MAADAASTTVTVTDRAGNPATATIAFPAVAKGTQDLSAFAYAAATATHGADAPALMAPEGARTTLSYTAAPAAVCTVDSGTGALTLVGLGACTITATAEASDDYNEATATFTVTVEAAGALVLNVDDIAGDGTVNIAEKTAGFTISGDTGPIGGAAVTVTVGSTVLSATSTDADPATWSVTVPANAAYIVEGDLSVTVDATKAGFTAAVQVARTLTVDLIAPTVAWTPPGTLQVGVAIDAVTPVTADTDIETWEATGLPPGLAIDTGTGALSGTPTSATAAATATVTVTDTAGNPATVDIAFPAVSKGAQDLSAFAYAAATATHGADAPDLIVPDGARTTLSYTAAPAAVCTVDSATGALTLVGLGACTITATAAASDDYNEATATFTVTVEAAGALVLNVDDIAGDGTVNIAEKTAGFTISGDTGPIGGAAVTVTVGATALSATSTDADPATWSVTVPADAGYIVEGDLSVTVDATKAGFTAAVQAARTLAVDLTAPAATWTPPATLQVGVAIDTVTPVTDDTDIASWAASGLPPGLAIDAGTGVLSGTPTAANAATATATATVTDVAGNPATVDIDFPAVSKGTQDLSAFAYDANTATHGADAPALMALDGARTTLSYTAAPAAVCTVDSATGALTLVGLGACTITATAAASDDYNEATATFTVTVEAAGALALTVGAIAGDGTVNIAEKTAGFTISGDTGPIGGAAVTVTVGSTVLMVTVTVSASKTGFTSPGDLTRTVTVDLTAPTAPTYTAPDALKVGEAITAMSPSGGSDVDGYSATGLPSGLTIDAGTGVIRGTPDMAADAASTTVTVTDSAGNPATVSIPFPEVAKGDQTLARFAYSPATVTFGDAAPTLTAPTGVQTTLSYSAAPADVCTVDTTSGELMLVGTGTCTITATADSDDNYEAATATATVTVQPAGTLALNLDAIAGDNTINIAEKEAGFTLSGDTGSEAGVSVQLVMDGRASGGGVTTVVVPSPSATSGTSTRAIWSYRVASGELDQSLNEPSVRVVVQATKTGFTLRLVRRTVTVDLTAPTAPTYTAPTTLTVGVAITDMDPSGGIDIASYSATDLPPGLSIDSTTGVISGTPDTAATTATITVTVTDVAGNPADASIAFPEVAKGDQTLRGFSCSSATVMFGDPGPTLTAPTGAQGTLSYAASPAEVCTLSYAATPAEVCTVNAASGALTLDGVGDCVVTATAESTDNHNQATADFTVTVAKGEQTLAGFLYTPASVAFGDTAPTVTAPTGAQGTLSYAASPAEVCTVNATSGALTLDGVGDCVVTATAEGTANYNQATADFTVTVRPAGNLVLTVTVDSAVAATITITDTSPATDPVTVSVDATSAAEGEAVEFTVTLSGTVASDVVLGWSTADGTATDADYTAVASGALTVTAGMTSATFTVLTLADLLAEGNETFTVTLVASGALPAGVSLVKATATGTIKDDDLITASVTAVAGTVTEGMEAQFTVALTGATSTSDVVVSYALGGTAMAGDDYTAPATPATLIRAGADTGTISIRTLTDGVLDPGETLVVTLDGVGTMAGTAILSTTDASATATIADPGMVTVSVAPGSAAEGEAVAFTVTLSGAVASYVALEWSTADGTATAGADYTAVSGGTVNFVAGGSLTRTISVTTLDDEVAEGDEEFTVTLNAAPGFVLPAGVSLGTATAIGTIEDDDEPGIVLSIATLTVHEGEMGTWQVALASEPTATTTITVSSPNSDVTVVDPEDETRRTRTRTLTFTPANWDTGQPVTVRVTDDPNVEADVTVDLSHTAGGADEYASLMTATVEMTIPGFEVDGKTVTLLVPEERLVTAPSGVRVYLPVAVATTTMVSIRAVAVDELPPAGPPPGFREGNVAVDIKLLGNGAMLPLRPPATVCLPVAGGDSERPRVWRYDESATPPEWMELPEPPQGSPAGLVCGETEHFSLFAVGSSASRPEVSDRRASVAKAWLARSGRTIAQHVLAGLQERLRAPREAGFEGALAGRGLDTSGAGWRDGRLPARAGTREDEWRDGRDGPARSDDAVTLRDLVTGSAFRVGAGNEETGFGEVWGRGAHSFVGGTDADLRLDGEVTTGTVGADYQRGRWTGGAALSHSEAEADYRSDTEEGRVGVSLTGVYPYAGFAVTDRVSVWGAGGYGEGDLQVEPDEGERAKADIRLTMVAAGIRGTLVKRADGFEAAAKADVLQVRTTSTETAELEAVEGRVGRVRVGLEGARPFALDNGASVTPELEVGVRHDAGDAETGFGMDLGAGLKWSAPGLRLSGNVDVRGLLVHEDEEFEEWTVSGSVRHAPATPSGRGLSYSLTQSWGAPGAGGGADRLWARETMSGMGAGGGSESGGRLEAEAGYGFPVLGGRFTGTPHVGLGVSDAGRDYRLGYRLDLVGGKKARFGLGIEARVPDGGGRGGRAPAPDLRLTGALRW